MHGGDAPGRSVDQHIVIARDLAASDFAVAGHAAFAEAADGVVYVIVAGQNLDDVAAAGNAGDDAGALVAVALEIERFAGMDVAVVGVVICLLGGSGDIQRVFRLNDGERAVVRRDTGGVVADAGKDGGNRSSLRRVNRRGIHGEERFVRGNAVALTEVEGEQRSGKRRGNLFGIRGDDSRVGGGGEGGGSRQRECRKSGGKRNQLFHGKKSFLYSPTRRDAGLRFEYVFS